MPIRRHRIEDGLATALSYDRIAGCSILHARRRRREWTGAFQWRWPHLERHACSLHARCMSIAFPQVQLVFSRECCLHVALLGTEA